MKNNFAYLIDNQKQLRLEGLIKTQKRSKKSLLESYNDLVYVHELSHLMLEYERKQYLNRKKKYKILLEECDQQIRYLNLFNYCFVDSIIVSTYEFDYKAVKEKVEKRKEILVEVIKVIDEFTTTSEESLRFSIQQLEKELFSYINPFECLSDPSEAIYYDIFETSESSKQFLLKRLRASIRKIVVKVNRDLRFSFRSIIRFLFKNMDDNSGEENILQRQLCKILFLHFKIIYPNGFKRNNTMYQ